MSTAKIRWVRRNKQKLVDAYLLETGRQRVLPSEFLEYVEARPEHELHDLWFGMDDQSAAHEHRKTLVRQFMAGLRTEISIEVQSRPVERPEYTVTIPSFISPRADRPKGGGYVQTNPDDRGHMRELELQAAEALERWLVRYEGAVVAGGFSVQGVRDVCESLRGPDGAAS